MRLTNQTHQDIPMKTISISTILLSTLFLFCLATYVKAEDQSKESNSQKDKSLFDDIRELAARMEVFPMDIYAQNYDGPLGLKAVLSRDTTIDPHYSKPSYWRYRYELSFDRFVPMFEFKECVYIACVNDVNDCVIRIEEMTPKEKALLLTAIYIFEYRNRHLASFDRMYALWAEFMKDRTVFDPIEGLDDPDGVKLKKHLKDYPKECRPCGDAISYQPDDSIDKEIWGKWLAVVGKYKDDKTIVFPAIDTLLDELKKEWEHNIEKCKQDMNDRWHIPFREQLYPHNPTKTHEFYAVFISLNDESPQEARFLHQYHEYFDVFYNSPLGESIFYCGNSSAEPKTLGDIATQILMSRLNYDATP